MKSGMLGLVLYLMSLTAFSITLEASQQLSIGGEIVAINPISTQNVSAGGGVGVIGSYRLSPSISFQGDMIFASHSTNYSFWSWYGPYNQEINTTSVALAFGPIYRPIHRRLSPLIGVLASYQHDYDSLANQSYYGTPQVYGTDSLYIGPTVGVDYQITRDVSAGFQVRYMTPVGTSTNLPYPYLKETPNYYQAGLDLKFYF